MWDMGDGWGWWMVFGWIWMVGVVAVVVWAVFALSRRDPNRPPERAPMTELAPLEVLERRYALGELSDEQFERMRQRLSQSASAAKASSPAPPAR